MKRLALLVLVLCSVRDAGAAAPAARKVGPAQYDVRSYGAVADGKTKATAAVKKAIDAAAAAGGGTVVFSGGTYLTGPIHLKSNITLFVDAGTVLKFSSDFDDYLPMVRSRWEGTEVVNFSPLIYGDKVENVAITGRGLIDGNGEPWWKMYRELKPQIDKPTSPATRSKWQQEFARLNTARDDWPDDHRWLENGFLRPPLIQILDCKNLLISDVTIKNPPFWTINPVYCDGVNIRGIRIDNPEDSPNTDGIDPESSRNVHISDSYLSTGDDCIAIKSGRDAQGRKVGRPVENVTITNCTMVRGHGGVSIGSEMAGGARRIAVSNCVFQDTERGIRIKTTRGRGNVVEDVRVTNIVVRDLEARGGRDGHVLHGRAARAGLGPDAARPQRPHLRDHRHRARGRRAAGAGRGAAGRRHADRHRRHRRDGHRHPERRPRHAADGPHSTQGGPAVTAENAGDLRLFDVGTLAPHAGTPVVTLVNVVARVPAGLLRAAGDRHVPLGARARHQGDHHRRERSGGRAHAADAGRRRVADRDHSTMIGATVVVPAP